MKEKKSVPGSLLGQKDIDLLERINNSLDDRKALIEKVVHYTLEQAVKVKTHGMLVVPLINDEVRKIIMDLEPKIIKEITDGAIK